MSREAWIVCDGCGAKEPIATQEGDPPPSFTHAKITVGTWGDDFDLCRACYNHSLEVADPRKWPRCAGPSPQ